MCDDSGVIYSSLYFVRYSCKESAAVVCGLTAHCALISVAFNHNYAFN